VTVLRPVIRSARPGDAPGIARVETETWRDAYPTLLPGSYLVDNPGSRSRWRKRLRGGGRNILIAEAAPRQIIAYATWGPVGRHHARPGGGAAGQLYELYVDADHREKGIGRGLCAEVARRMVRRGMGTLYVEVLEGNPNRFFYEALGARLVARTHHEFAGQRLVSVVYLWTKLNILADRRAG
jgi:ribosomal protein S18 acetylase RimI-like enzyme